MKTAGSRNHSHLRSDRGMTLIDMAVFLIVIGLITVPMMKQYDNFQVLKAKGESDNNIASINKAMADYYYENGDYPCPSVITLPITDPNYGVGDCAATAQPGNIHIGGVPFVDLKIPEKFSIDGWSNRLQYTVSNLVVNLGGAPFPVTPATGITVRRFNYFNPATLMICDGSMNAPMTNGHYVIVSTGSRGIGGFTSTGVAKDACPLGGATQEAENCNNDTTFFDDICARSDRNNASYYDDIVWPINVAPSRIWVYSNAAVPDPTDIVSVVTKIGINNPAPFNNPGDPNGVDVRGNILAGDGTTPGRVISDIMCDVNGNNCFKPDLIGGLPDPRNNCDLSARGAMRGLGNPDGHPLGGHAVCQTSYLPSASTVCGPGQFAIGFQGGRIRCYTPP